MVIMYSVSFRANSEMKHDGSDEESEEENEEGDYTVYECPGLAPVSITSDSRLDSRVPLSQPKIDTSAFYSYTCVATLYTVRPH